MKWINRPLKYLFLVQKLPLLSGIFLKNLKIMAFRPFYEVENFQKAKL
jgi:hypothetical protein